MFAFALWHADRETLFLARDRLGEKPLYYAEWDGWFVFGSEVRAVLEHPGVGRELDPLGLARYLTNTYVPDPHSIFRGIRKLPPGHFLTVASGKTRIVRYWDLRWLRGPLRPLLKDVLHPDRLRRVGLFSPEVVDRLVGEHLAGKQNHQRSLWTLLAFELWREAYLPRDSWI